ncbi:CRAL/TRIO domain-containing protein [Colletotrichum graminicola]|uniref:Phosphatidylinositol transfer protein SFH5 n=1 Tax=Colletotrichum graminicola (strain M1.001 / M2 / FGSC 10212) TaxID=645133 RepID=E3QF44_COLGM|nr:CRAL/TRIO domain-containing protein [Colletotrichum graminicola M1.001]EFQ29482.1 CRAL/TRIO domain-containing protein [Colletotrichum graminicola M1.001]WDK23435.1 CRAL/TRIO domain-containing protein [Colletotrichum graminicola]
MSAQATDTAVPAPAPAAAPAPAVVAESQTAAATPAADPTSAPAAPAAADAAAPEVAAAAQQPQAEQTAPADQKTEANPGVKPATEKPVEKTQTPLTSLFEKLPGILGEAKHNEMWGVQLSDSTHVPTTVVLQKFLRANDNDVSKAADQLQKALVWRRDTNPGKLLDDISFDKKKFGELGYVTTHKDAQGKDMIITWNIYGAVKDKKATFGNVDEFIKWRAALMELSVRKLGLDKVQTPIPDGGEDPYQMIQVHDYLNVSFLRMDPAVKAASSETIRIFAMAYPELLVHKYFVNIPALMGWVFKAMKVFLAPKTIAKFHPLGYGNELAAELPAYKDSLPKDYGGNGESIKITGQTVKLADAAPAAPVEQPATDATLTTDATPANAPAPATDATPATATPATDATPANAPAPATEAADPAVAETKVAEPVVAPQPEKTAEVAPSAAAVPEKTEVPSVADLSINDKAEAK